MLRCGWMWTMLALTGLAAGCTCHLTTMPCVEEDLHEACEAIALDSRSHVYLFFLQGSDVADCADLEGLKETVQSLGFGKAWFGYCCHVKAFKKEIARIYYEDEKAQFVLVGLGKGVATAAKLAQATGAQDIHFALLVGLGSRVECPTSVAHQMTIMPPRKRNDDATVFEVPVDHIWGLPGHPLTVKMLAQQLFALAGSIPSVSDLPKLYHDKDEPRPRPVMPLADNASKDEWDFLRPAAVDDREHLPPKTLPELKKWREALHPPKQASR